MRSDRPPSGLSRRNHASNATTCFAHFGGLMKRFPAGVSPTEFVVRC